MLLKAEKILSHDGVMIDKSQAEIIDMVKWELAEDIVRQMLEEGLAKIEVRMDDHPAIGEYVRVRVTVRAYNPDD